MAELDNNTTTIQLDTMSLDQLDQLKQREESRLQSFTARFAALRQAAARLAASSGAVTELYTKNDGNMNMAEEKEDTRDVFVPLTESVYVPGKIITKAKEQEALLVELGTGYFVEKSATDTVEFLQRKTKLVNANSENGKCVLVLINGPRLGWLLLRHALETMYTCVRNVL